MCLELRVRSYGLRVMGNGSGKRHEGNDEERDECRREVGWNKWLISAKMVKSGQKRPKRNGGLEDEV